MLEASLGVECAVWSQMPHFAASDERWNENVLLSMELNALPGARKAMGVATEIDWLGFPQQQSITGGMMLEELTNAVEIGCLVANSRGVELLGGGFAARTDRLDDLVGPFQSTTHEKHLDNGKERSQ